MLSPREFVTDCEIAVSVIQQQSDRPDISLKYKKIQTIKQNMADAKVDAGSEISAKDLKKKLAEETENGKDAPANGKADEENGEPEIEDDDDDDVEEDDDDNDGEGDDDDDEDETEGGTKRAAEDEDDDEDEDDVETKKQKTSDDN